MKRMRVARSLNSHSSSKSIQIKLAPISDAGRLLLLATDRADLFPCVGGRADVAVGGDCHEDLVPSPSVKRERTRALHFDVIGMSADRKNVHGNSRRMRGSILT